MIEDAEGVHELLADPALVRQGVDARMFCREIAGNGLYDGLAWMVILRPRVDLDVWVSVVPKVLDETLDDLSVGRNAPLLCHAVDSSRGGRSLDWLSQNWDNWLSATRSGRRRETSALGRLVQACLSELSGCLKEDMGNALGIAQFGGTAPTAKPWKGLGPGVLEIVESYDGNAYRAVYTVRFEKAVYVLRAFQKKSPSGIRTAKRDVDRVSERLKTAEQDYEEHYGKSKR